MAIFARIWEGASYGAIGSTTYGVSSQELPPEEFDKYARSNSTVAGLGQGLSLVLGSFLFNFGGYMMPYFVLGSVFLLFALIVFITRAFDEKDPKSDENLESALANRGMSYEVNNSSIELEPCLVMNHKIAFSIPVSSNFF